MNSTQKTGTKTSGRLRIQGHPRDQNPQNRILKTTGKNGGQITGKGLNKNTAGKHWKGTGQIQSGFGNRA